MAKSKKPKETITPSDDLIARAVLGGQALIAEGASLTPKGALTYSYNCRRKLSRERSE